MSTKQLSYISKTLSKKSFYECKQPLGEGVGGSKHPVISSIFNLFKKPGPLKAKNIFDFTFGLTTLHEI
jgi:hypothetical protein